MEDRFNKTSTMHTRKLLEPVILEKQARGREMQSKSVIRIKGADGGSTEPGEDDNKPETFHEGYIADKKYLVPDSNLRAMADMINFKMRKSENAKSLQLAQEKDEIGWYSRKKDSIIRKLDDLDFPEEEEEEEEEEDEEQKDEQEQEEEQEEEEKEEEEAAAEEEEEEEGEEEGEEEEEKEEAEEEEVEEEEVHKVEEEAEEEEVEEEEVHKVEEEAEEEEVEEEEVLTVEEEEADAEEEEVEEEEVPKVEEEEAEEEEVEEEEVLKVEEEESAEEAKLEEEEVEDEELEEEGEEVEEEEESVKEELEEEEESVKEDMDEEEESVKEEMEKEEEPVIDQEEEEVLNEEPKAVVQDIKMEPDEDKDTIFPGKYYDPNVKRFLISGHFRTNRKPIYIIHQYAGPSVFSTKDPDFYSHKIEKDTDIFISGEFYKDTILEEDENNQPKRLKTKPRKIFVDSSSRIYEDKFSDTFVGEDVDVTLTGSFIKQTLSTMCTPMLTISLKKGTGTANRRKAAAPVYVSRPVVHNIFEMGREIPSLNLEKPRRVSSGDRDVLLKKPRNKSKLSLRQRKKAGYSPCSTNRSELHVLVSQPKVKNPFLRRHECDERHSHSTREIVGDTPIPFPNGYRTLSDDKRNTHMFDENERREKTKAGTKRKIDSKQKTIATCTDLEREGCGKSVITPINVDMKIVIKHDEKKSAAKKILDHFFHTK